MSFLFCMFLALLSLSFSSYSRIAASAFIFSSFPSYISSLYWLTYCLITFLCCFFRSFSNFLFFNFSYSFVLLSCSSPFLIWFWIISEVPWSLRDRTALSFFRCLSGNFLFRSAAPCPGESQSREVCCWELGPPLYPGRACYWRWQVIFPYFGLGRFVLVHRFCGARAPPSRTSESAPPLSFSWGL